MSCDCAGIFPNIPLARVIGESGTELLPLGSIIASTFHDSTAVVDDARFAVGPRQAGGHATPAGLDIRVVSKTARPVRRGRLNLGPNAGALSSHRDRKSSAQNPTYGDARGSGVILTKRSWQRLTNSGSRTRVKRAETLEKSRTT